MDRLRATAKAVFYDFPLDDLYSLVMGKGKKGKKFLDDIGKLMSVREDAVNMACNKLTAMMFDKTWAVGSNRLQTAPALTRCFYLAAEYASYMLKVDGNHPIVKFDELLRWRELSRLMGEELLSVAYLAQNDDEERTFFCWKNVLDTDYSQVCGILKNGVCDIHSHLNATYDTFILNWIGLMNQIKGRAKDFDQLRNPMDNPIVLRDYQFSDLYSWCIIAAKIRTYLYQVFVMGKNEKELIKPFDWIPTLLKVTYYNVIISDIQGDIDYLRRMAMNRYETDEIIDYAIDIDPKDEYASSPHVVFQGERKIQYSFLRKYFRGEVKNPKTIHLAYLYERIKTELRKELVQTNSKSGLMNFKLYNNSKDRFSRQDEYLKDVKLKYGVQTGLETEGTQVEGRICVDNADRMRQLQYSQAIFNNKDLGHDCSKVSFVIHLLKCSDFSKSNRHYEDKRREWILEVNKALKIIKENAQFVGIDFAGSELYTRPEVPAHVVRYAKVHGINNVTYHVGEDYYDIVDGLRAIDETIRFMGLDQHCRIGHALAMAVDAMMFYESQGKEIVLPKQVLLDNLVWMIKTTENNYLIPSPTLYVQLMERCKSLYEEIGYDGTFSLDDYYESMMLRSDDEMEYEDEGHHVQNGLNNWVNTMVCRHPEGINYRSNIAAMRLWRQYLMNSDICRKGDEPALFRVDKRYIRQVERLQAALRKKVEERGICVEVNLTSNILISNMKRYDRHPIRKMRNTSGVFGNQIPVALGTDDKGILATSLVNEYALLALSMKKQRNWTGRKWSDKKIESYLRLLAETSIKHRFTRDGIK